MLISSSRKENIMNPSYYKDACFLKGSCSCRWHSCDLQCMLRVYKDVSKSFRTGCLERELQMVRLSATRCSCIAVLWVSLVSFAAITFYVASEQVFVVVSLYFAIDSVRKLLDTPSNLAMVSLGRDLTHCAVSACTWQHNTAQHRTTQKELLHMYIIRDPSLWVAYFIVILISATGWMIWVLGFDSRRGLWIFLFTASRPALGPT
jgi:hypothetical protein